MDQGLPVFGDLNSYTFHINLYDLAFLGAIFIGLAFAVLLYFAKTVNRNANRLLALALATMILWMIRVLAIDIRLVTYLPRWDRLPMQFLLALGPLMYFYVLKITRMQYKFRWKDLLHFSPLLAEQAALIPEIRESSETGVATYATKIFQHINPVLQLLIFISIITYLYRSHKLILHFYTRQPIVMMDRSRLEFRWLCRLLAATALLWILWIVCTAVDYFGYHNQSAIRVYYPFYIFFAVIIIWTAAAAFLKPQAAIMAPEVTPVKQPVPDEFRAKGARLKKAMEANLYYQDPELTLSLLAEKLQLHPHELSRIINTALKKSFNDFVNEYRIRDVILKMRDSANDGLTMVGIAFEAGFNSKSTFNRIFRQMTGKSPAEFKASQQNDSPTYHLSHHLRTSTLISNHQTTHKWTDVKLNRNYMFRNYLKIAWRNLLKDRQFTLLNHVGLSTGLACTFLIYLWVTDERNVDKFNEKDSQLYQVMLNIPLSNGIQTQEYTPGLLAKSLAEEIPEIGYAASVKPGYEMNVLTAGEKHIKAMPQFVDKDYFNIFSYNFIQGDKSRALSNKYAIILSDELAGKLFGYSTDVIGKTVQWGEDSTRYIISGVFKKPLNATANFDVMFTYRLYFDKHIAGMQNWQNSSPSTYIILKKGANTEQVNNKIAAFIKRKDSKSTATLFLRKFSDKYLYDKYENGRQAGGRIEYVRLFSIIAIFLLLIACINFMNLSTAKAARRLKEVGIKKVTGASRAMLIFQFLGESMLMTFLSITIAIILVYFFLPQFNTITQKHLALHFDIGTVLPIVGIGLVTGLIAGSYPAFYLSAFNPVTVLKGRLKTSLSELWVRKGLVVFQFVLSAIFIVSVLVIYKQMQLIQTMNLEYNKDNVITFKNEGRLNKNLQSFLADVKNMPGILGASSFRGDLTGNHGGTENLSWEGKNPDEKIDFASIDIDYGLTEMLDFKMAQGRMFSRQFGSDSSRIIFNETAIKAMGIKDPIGKSIKVWGGTYQIIGVVKDFHFESLYETVKPCFMRYYPAGGNVLVKIKGGDEKASIERIKNLYQAYNRDMPFEYKFLDTDYQALYVSEQRVAVLSRYFAGLAIIVSCLGLFGLAAFTAQKRQKEIGVRKVLGASAGNIAFMLSKDFLKLVLIAIIIAFPLALWITIQWLQGFAYRIVVGFNVFLLAGTSIIIVSICTVSFQAIRAAVANPVKSLRSE